MQNLPLNVNPNLNPQQFLQANPQLTQGYNADDLFQQSVQAAQQLQPQEAQAPLSNDEAYAKERADVQASLDALNASRESIQNPLKERGANILDNFVKDMGEVGTGITYFFTHLPELAAEAPEGIKNYFASGKTGADAILDTANLILENYNIDVRTLSDRDLRDILGGVAQGIYEHPFSFMLDAMSLGAGGKLAQMTEKIPVLGRVQKATNVEKRLAAENVEGARRLEAYSDKMKAAEAAAKEAGVDFKDVLKAGEEGTKLPAGGKESFKLLKEANKDYNDIIKYVSPETYRGMEETAINQKILRERLKSNPSATFNDVSKETRPLFDLINQDEYLEVLDLAKGGNKVAKEVVGAKALYDKGRLTPITHVGAEVLKGIDTTGKLSDAILNAGQFSTRVLGNSTYDALAKAVTNPSKLIDTLGRVYLDKNVSGGILRGEFLPDIADSKNLVYMSRDLLEQGKLRGALERASSSPTSAKDVPIDKDYFNVLKEQLSRGETYLTGTAKDIFNTQKGAMLGSGTYVFGNMITGAANTVMNSGAMALGDIIDAVKSGGNLAKQAGIYRYTNHPEVATPVLKQINAVNRFTGDKFSYLDKAVQNLWAETALHSNLRRAGIPIGERANAITNMAKEKLGDMIVDAKRVALINSPRTITPAAADAAMTAISPFWRWLDTATQSSIHMLRKNPIASNIIMQDIVSNICFDKELQNRLNLNVQSDKPFVSYRFNDKTGKIEELSIEMMPVMTTLKLADAKTYLTSGGNPVLGALINSVQGKNMYGGLSKRPTINGVMTEIVGKKRYQTLPNGDIQEIGGQFDETLNAAVKSLFGFPRLYNKTMAPLLAPVLSPTGQYYQPYDMGLLGGFTPQLSGGNIISAGNPENPRDIRDVGVSMLTGRISDYYPDRGITPNIRRQFMRQHNRRLNRMIYE